MKRRCERGIRISEINRLLSFPNGMGSGSSPLPPRCVETSMYYVRAHVCYLGRLPPAVFRDADREAICTVPPGRSALDSVYTRGMPGLYAVPGVYRVRYLGLSVWRLVPRNPGGCRDERSLINKRPISLSLRMFTMRSLLRRSPGVFF